MCLTIVVNSVFVVLCLECVCRSLTNDATSQPQMFCLTRQLVLQCFSAGPIPAWILVITATDPKRRQIQNDD